MNPTVLLSIVLTLALVTMFALGLYWLNTRHRPHPVPPAPAAPAVSPTFSACSAGVASPSFNPAETDEWEANAHWQEPDPHTASGNDDAAHTWQSIGQRTSPDATDIDDLRHELYESLRDIHPDIASPVPPPTPPAPTSRPDSTPRCPQCRSSRIDVLNRARKAGSTIGSVAGATSGMAMALSGAEAGAVVGSIVGPVGTVFGGLAGAVIAGLVGSAAGCAAGSAVGAAIDENVLDNQLCLSCGHTFSKARP